MVNPDGSLAPQAPSATNIFLGAGQSTPAVTAGSSPRLPSRGTFRFQCCFHPWMHTAATVR